MKKLFIKISILLSLLTLISCFEIVEDITINDDGSGKILLALNLSKSKTKLKSIMLLDSINGYKIPSKTDITKSITDIKTQIGKIKGVTNVKSMTDFKDYIFTVSCNFNNVNALNTIISSFSSSSEKKLISKNKHFTYNKATHSFSRNYHYNLAKETKKMNTKDKAIFQDASITTIYRFESDVVSVKNKNAKVSGNKKAVFLKVSAQDIINNKSNIKNTIQLK